MISLYFFSFVLLSPLHFFMHLVLMPCLLWLRSLLFYTFHWILGLINIIICTFIILYCDPVLFQLFLIIAFATCYCSWALTPSPPPRARERADDLDERVAAHPAAGAGAARTRRAADRRRDGHAQARHPVGAARADAHVPIREYRMLALLARALHLYFPPLLSLFFLYFSLPFSCWGIYISCLLMEVTSGYIYFYAFLWGGKGRDFISLFNLQGHSLWHRSCCCHYPLS